MPKDNNGILVLLGVAGLVYIIPSMIAFGRGHPNRWIIFVVNVAGGVTVFGWLLTLVWAFQKTQVDEDWEVAPGAAEGAKSTASSRTEELVSLRELLDADLISRAEFDRLKSELLSAPK